jgi:tRNA threonylcarbamoyladenosine biosynthesis protein TsaE
MKTFFAKAPDDLKEVAKTLIAEAGNSRLFAFYGEMGVGKTTFILEILKVLGVVDKGSSPTYSLVNEYRTGEGKPVYHFDFYRIEDVEEVYDIGYEDYFFSGSYCFIEWPERIAELLPDNAVIVNMKDRGADREIQINVPQ